MLELKIITFDELLNIKKKYKKYGKENLFVKFCENREKLKIDIICKN